jgi:hypothetical protein
VVGRCSAMAIVEKIVSLRSIQTHSRRSHPLSRCDHC